MQNGPENYDENDRPQDFWENNRLIADDFSFDDFDQCPLMRGEIGRLLKTSISAEIRKTAIKLVRAMASLPAEQLNAIILNSDPALSIREIGRRLNTDHKGAQRKIRAAKAQLQQLLYPTGAPKTPGIVENRSSLRPNSPPTEYIKESNNEKDE